MTENQKLRDAFDHGWKMAAQWSLSDHLLADMESPAYLIERDGRLLTLALPTADHIPDAGEKVADHLPNAGKMIQTAAPVGERERFEAYFAWSRKSKGANRRPNFERFEEDGTYKDDHTQRHWWTWQQALSAGNAVDGLHDGEPVGEVAQFSDDLEGHLRGYLYNPLPVGTKLYAAAQIDASMRKGQL